MLWRVREIFNTFQMVGNAGCEMFFQSHSSFIHILSALGLDIANWFEHRLHVAASRWTSPEMQAVASRVQPSRKGSGLRPNNRSSVPPGAIQTTCGHEHRHSCIE